jgi:hypothetical protein
MIKRVQFYILLFASIYFVIWLIWGDRYAVQIIGLLTLAALFLNLYSWADRKYYDGLITVERTDTGGKLFSLLVEDDPEELEQRDLVVFKVVSKEE